MTSAVLTPERRGSLVELGNGRWKKQILPLGSINYRGRKITFDREYLTGLVQSFRKQACGPVPFQVADSDNKHTNDPLRRHGTVVDLEIADDGLYGVVELDETGQQLVEQYPDLGVSARIYENYERSDGQFFPAALQHVLGTLDPHVTGMRPWQAVALSQDVSGPVIDLSDSEFDNGKEEGKPVATKSDLKSILAKLRESGDEAELSDEELDQLLAITDAMSEVDKTTDASVEDELTDEELDALIAAAESEIGDEDSTDVTTSGDEDAETETEGGDQVPQTDPQLIAASNEQRAAIELANARLEQTNIELAAVRQKLAAQEFESEQRTFAQQYGIPPQITELARPLLEGDSHVIQLANGDEVDAGAVMRKVLVELGNTIKVLDLGGLIGRSEDEPTDDESEQAKQRADDTRSFIDKIKSSYTF
jgi:hypothetical protein